MTTQTTNKPAKVVGSGIQGYSSSADGLPALCVSHSTQVFHSMQKKWITAKRMTSRSPKRWRNHHRFAPKRMIAFWAEMKMRKMTTRDPASPAPYVTEVRGISDWGNVNGRKKY